MQPLQRKSLAQELAESLRHSIERGAFAIDEKLPSEPELMKKFGVGRSTVREAIKYLAQSGFVSVQQGLGTFVVSHTGTANLDAQIERADFAELFEVRQLLEVKVVEKACLNRTAAQLKTMRGKLKDRQRFAEEGKVRECIQADIEFHVAMAESCGNTILAELYKAMSGHVEKFFFQVYGDTVSFIESQEVHEALLRHVADKDVAEAVGAVRQILGRI